VCETFSALLFVIADGLRYMHCRTCQAIYLAPEQRLPGKQEYAYYCQHQNNPYDRGYRRFLMKLSEPLLKKLSPGANGLDFGCGPGPALAYILREAGYRMQLFDLFFFPDRKPLYQRYDFITCTETIEHLHHPAEIFASFDKMLKPGGWLALMTCFLTDENLFRSWHYRRDPTHVVFYRATTLHYIADRFGWSCEIPVKDVALMQKPHVINRQ
jgi:SAM-dependent methyltransferase